MWISILKIILCCGILCFESFVDIRKKKVHILGAVMIAAIGIFVFFMEKEFHFFSFLLSISVGICLFFVSILTEEKIGKGDALYMTALGCVMDFREILMVSMLSFLLSALAGIIAMIVKKAKKDSRIAYLPFLTCGYMLVSCLL